MTSALRVLALALVISTIGTTSTAGSADDDRSRMPPHIDHRDLYKPFYPNMKSRTNTVRNSIYNKIININTNQKRSFNDNDYEDKIVHRNSRQHGEGALAPLDKRRVKRESNEQDCNAFLYKDTKKMIMHPHDPTSINKTYYRDIDCVTVIRASPQQTITLTFVDFFEIEDHPKCEYDFLEIRDGQYGYADLVPAGKYCGSKFPQQVKSSGPALWLKFHSDETIEYKGFQISIEFTDSSTSYIPTDACNIIMSGSVGMIESTNITKECLDASKGHHLDVLWSITVQEKHTIFLNFSSYSLSYPNECEENVIQVFGYVLEFDSNLAHYCGSIANPVLTKGSDKNGKDNHGNIMYVRFFASKKALEKPYFFNATFTEFYMKKEASEDCTEDNDKFDCEDNTCIKYGLRCNGYGNCRLKTDEDGELCKLIAESIISEPHILAILVIFCLIISGMTFVFLFKCIRKLYHDHKLIKEHISQSCEDRLDTLIDSRFTLDPKNLQRDSEPRASLERDNHTNELVKQQRKISQQRKTSSLDSDMLQETQIDFDDEPWRREVDITPLQENKPERNGRTRRRDTSKREESIRRNKDRDSGEPQERKRDASVGAPDTKESGCQTRESLFQGEAAPSEGSANSGNSRGFSTFGYSGGTIARPSPPAPAPAPAPQTTEITIELLRQMTPQESLKPQKKIPDRRPMSTETTRSAPDVIIVSKPIR